MLSTWTCIEVGAAYWNIWQVNRSKVVSEAEQISVPAILSDWNPDVMAPYLEHKITGRKVLFILNTAQTLVRLTPDPFPVSEDCYIFSSTDNGAFTWREAVILKISNSLVELCRLNKINQKRIKAIDTLAHRMACYFSPLYSDVFWIIIPQEPGVRLISLCKGVPYGCYFFSVNPDYREKELVRIWQSQSESPKYAAILFNEADYDLSWIIKFLKQKAVAIIEGDFKKKMIEEWVRI